MTESHIYEQPTNERIRAFLRLEKLFEQYSFHLDQGATWNNQIAIDAINELLAFTARSDIKLEALKELERQHTRLERLSKRPQIDQSQLLSLLQKQKQVIGELTSITGQLGQSLQSIELLSSIRQKNSVPGCICDFDLPVYQFWLNLPEHERQKHLKEWFTPFTILDKAINLILDVLRNSVEPGNEVATNGFFQQSLDTNQAVQLLRIKIETGTSYYPEISAGKHRFSIRFMTNDDPSKRPEQYKNDVNFKLGMCSI